MFWFGGGEIKGIMLCLFRVFLHFGELKSIVWIIKIWRRKIFNKLTIFKLILNFSMT